MEQHFSPGLLYTVAPENFSELHLQDDVETDKLEWSSQEPATLRHAIFSFFAKHAKTE